MDRLAEQAAEAGLTNLETVVCPEDSVALPPASVDLVFIADTYHHFEYPAGTLASIHEALRPGGEMVVIDFERIPGESSEWVFEHVRAGKETVVGEIKGAGFELVAEPAAPYLADNYVLRFRKVSPR
jgi:predicted methyltransferase